MIAHAPLSLQGWVRAIDEADIPILERSALAIAALQADEDNVSARDIADLAQEDPLLSLRILAHAAHRRSSRMSSQAETVTACLLMMGTSAFFKSCAQAPTVESRLAHVPGALDGLRRVLDRSHRAARLAIGFAMHRQDTDAEVIHEAALLHDFAEMLLWCHAPHLALTMRSRQRADPTLRSAQIQREILHIELSDLEQALMRAWQLPELLRELTDPHLNAQARVRNVLLATALARHSQNGWNNAALPDDFEAIGQLLNLSTLAVRSLVRTIDLTTEDPAY
jgi:HD-like signal output (HDOD) protein